MKAKVKIRLKDDSYQRNLYIKLKLEPEKFYWHEEIIVRNNIYDEHGHWQREKTDLEFYTEVYEFISDKYLIKKVGEKIVKDIIANNKESFESNSQEKKVKSLLKKMKKPVEIEIVE